MALQRHGDDLNFLGVNFDNLDTWEESRFKDMSSCDDTHRCPGIYAQFDADDVAA